MDFLLNFKAVEIIIAVLAIALVVFSVVYNVFIRKGGCSGCSGGCTTKTKKENKDSCLDCASCCGCSNSTNKNK